MPVPLVSVAILLVRLTRGPIISDKADFGSCAFAMRCSLDDTTVPSGGV